MTEVSSWSPTDASNNLTPPDGWPEGMQPSGVNDVGRMMMGAIRRWYNTVSAGIAAAMPISGGTFTGAITAPLISSTGNLNVSGTAFLTQADVAGDLNVSGTMHSTQATVDNNLNVSGTAFLTQAAVSGDAAVSGTLTATNETINSNLTVGGNATVSGTMHASQGTIDGNLTVGASASVSGTMHASQATVDGGLSVGNSISVGNTINSATYQIDGIPFADHSADGASFICDFAGQPAVVMYGGSGTYYRAESVHSFTNRAATSTVCRFQPSDGQCINNSGSWVAVSDAAVKVQESFTPYTAGLAEVLQLNPMSFSYIAGKTPFATEGKTFYGLVAQDVEPVLPEMVGRTPLDDGSEVATLLPTHLVYVLLNAVKELEARLAQLENRGG